MMKPSFCDGTIIHDRIMPRKHRFIYNMSWCLFDLDKIEALFYDSKFWSINKFNLVSIKNKDYVNPGSESINIKIRKYIKGKTDRRFDGKIFLFTHPRYLGFGFNSVNFYFCFEGNAIKYIVSEINNTPWKEKHLYFHDNSENTNPTKDNKSGALSFNFNKEFHISPFVDMEIKYDWKFELTEDKIKISMKLLKGNTTPLKVYLNTNLTHIKKHNTSKWALKKPYQALKMSAGIYWQAFKLWLKKVPIYDHPKTANEEAINNNIKSKIKR